MKKGKSINKKKALKVLALRNACSVLHNIDVGGLFVELGEEDREVAITEFYKLAEGIRIRAIKQGGDFGRYTRSTLEDVMKK